MIEPIKNSVNFGKIETTHRSNNKEEYKIKFTQEEVFTSDEGSYTITQVWEPKDPSKLDIQA